MFQTRVWTCEECEGPAKPCVYIQVMSNGKEGDPTGCPMANDGKDVAWSSQNSDESGAGENISQQAQP